MEGVLTSRLRWAQGPLGYLCLPRVKHAKLQLVYGQPETLVGAVEAKVPGWFDNEYENSLCLESWTQGLTWLLTSEWANALALALECGRVEGGVSSITGCMVWGQARSL